MTGPQTAAAMTGAAPDIATLRFRERARQRLGVCELLLFRLGRELFGVELRAVEEAIEVGEVRPIPGAPRGLLGVITLRDRLLPLFSAADVLGPESGNAAVALVMRGGSRPVALAVDEAEEVIHASLDALRDPPPGANDDDVVAGLLWREHSLVTVLDARALVTACIGTAPVLP